MIPKHATRVRPPVRPAFPIVSRLSRGAVAVASWASLLATGVLAPVLAESTGSVTRESSGTEALAEARARSAVPRGATIET